MAERILIVEDETSVAEGVAYALEREAYAVTIAADGNEALRLFDLEPPDLVILDLMLPGISGWQLLPLLRQRGPVPVIMLTARTEEPDRVAGLEMGADDYVTKPFSMRELVARVRSVLRRPAPVHEPSAVIAKAGVRLDADRHEVEVSGKPVQLSLKEFELLAYLMRHAGRTRSRDDILAAVWGQDAYLDERTVDVHIRWLRTKIETDPGNPERILTIRGVGYKFTDTP